MFFKEEGQRDPENLDQEIEKARTNVKMVVCGVEMHDVWRNRSNGVLRPLYGVLPLPLLYEEQHWYIAGSLRQAI